MVYHPYYHCASAADGSRLLGTFAGNEIDEALILPYDALGLKEQKF